MMSAASVAAVEMTARIKVGLMTVVQNELLRGTLTVSFGSIGGLCRISPVSR